MALLPGDPVPKFSLPGTTVPRFTFDSAAGRYLVVAFVRPDGAEAAQARITARPEIFDDVQASAFVVVVGDDPEREARRDHIPGLRFLFDADEAVAGQYGTPEAGRWHLVDPALQLLAVATPERADWLIAQIAGMAPRPCTAASKGWRRS